MRNGTGGSFDSNWRVTRWVRREVSPIDIPIPPPSLPPPPHCMENTLLKHCRVLENGQMHCVPWRIECQLHHSHSLSLPLTPSLTTLFPLLLSHDLKNDFISSNEFYGAISIDNCSWSMWRRLVKHDYLLIEQFCLSLSSQWWWQMKYYVSPMALEIFVDKLSKWCH